jgi:hypothetical protein
MIVTSSAVTGRRDAGNGRSVRTAREAIRTRSRTSSPNGEIQEQDEMDAPLLSMGSTENGNGKSINVFAYGVARNRLRQAARQLNVHVNLVDALSEADVLVTLKSYYRKRRQLISDAERQRKPVYILRANTLTQMEYFLGQAFELDVESSDPFEKAISEAERAIQLVNAGRPGVNLSPVASAIRRYQHQLARQANLVSHSYGREPRRYVRIFKEKRN